ncbi:MAG: TonB-dependent receptor [Promethearchaeota archaeon]
MRLKYTLFLFFFFLLHSIVFSGTTGKLAGKITDFSTGEALPGVNITIEGTMLGAATDIDGNYTILNLAPGTYTVHFSFIGYQETVVKNISINVDFTTRLDQTISESSVELGEVEVIAERNPIVRQDLTNTQVAVNSETINSLPVDEINQVIQLQAGVITDNSGELHMRGGRSNEVAIQVNGISIANPFDNSQSVDIATNAVQEVSVSVGTFSAEYGNALSGVVNYVTKEGGNNLDATFRAWTGEYFSSKNDIYFGVEKIDPLNNVRLEGTLGGPIPLLGNKVKFFISGVYRKNKGYLNGIDLYKPEDILLIKGDTLVLDPKGDGLPSGSGDIVPIIVNEKYNITSKISYSITPEVKLSYDYVFSNSEGPSSNQFRNYRFNPDGMRILKASNSSNSLSMTHILSNSTFYTLKLAANFTSATNAAFDNPLDSRYVASYEGNVSNNLFPQTDYMAGGHNLNRTEDNTNSYVGKIDFISQVTQIHELRFGGEYIQHELERENYELLHTDITGNSLQIIPYPELNPDYTNYQYYKNKPTQASLYILDKMELAQSFILNLGLRYEYFHSKAPYNPDLVETVDEGVENFLIDSEAKQSLAPRISLSFPITDEGIIRFSYGHFYQNPNLTQIYRNPRFEDFDFIRKPIFGNANLEPENSIQYEVGLQQGLTSDLKMDFTVYYKDVSNLIQSRVLVAGEAAASKEFEVITNVSYAIVKGFTISLLKRRSIDGLLSGSLDYSFQVAEGSFEDPLDYFVDTRSDRQTEQKIIPLSHERSHTLNASLILSDPGNWLVSTIANLWTGTPYTPSLPSNLTSVTFENNSDKRPTLFNVDLRLEKFFAIGSINMSLFLQVNNLFDFSNEGKVHTTTGKSLTSLDETTKPNRFDVLRRQMEENPETFFPSSFLDNFYKREDWLNPPREIRVGLSLSYN